MNKDNKLYLLIPMITYTLALVYNIVVYYKLPTPLYLVIFFVAISLLFYILIFRKTKILLFFVSALLIVSIIIYLIDERFIILGYNNIKNFILWGYDFAFKYQDFSNSINKYSAPLCILVSFIFSFFSYLLIYNKQRVFFAFIFGIESFMLTWLDVFTINPLSLVSYIFSILLILLIKIFISSGTNIEKKDIYNFILAIIPFALIVTTLVYIIPKRLKPLEWEWLDNKYFSLYSRFVNKPIYSEYEIFSLFEAGFGKNDNKLGGKVELNDIKVLEVQASKTIYLRGRCFDNYLDNSWKASKDYRFSNSTNIINDELEEFLWGISYFGNIKKSEAYDNEYCKSKVAKIKFSNLKSKSIFAPIKIIDFTPFPPYNETKKEIFINKFGIMLNSNLMPKNYTYSFDFLDINYKKNNVQELLRNSKKGLYDEIILKIQTKSMDKIGDTNVDDIIKYKNNSNSIYNSIYMRIPEATPNRVKELAFTITQNEQTNYDKVKKIETYLRENISYTLEPKEFLEDRDFVDWVLFDSKQGYCTFYATSMCILTRAIGLPSRLVEGYVLPSKPEISNTYYVTNKNAHAWVEVYFEGFGWITFEPTAPFYSALYDETANPNYYSSFENSERYKDYIKELGTYKNTMPTEQDKNISMKGFFINTSIFLGLIIFTIIIINIIKFKIIDIKAHKYKSKEGFLNIFYRLIRMLIIVGFPINEGEMPLEFSKRVDNHYTFKNRKFEEIVRVYEKVRFGESYEDEDYNLVLEFYEDCFYVLKKDIGRIRYFVYRFIIGKV